MAKSKGEYTNPYGPRYNFREIARMKNLDPGSGPSLEDYVCDLEPQEQPTLDSMTENRDAPNVQYPDRTTSPISKIPSEEMSSGKENA